MISFAIFAILHYMASTASVHLNQIQVTQAFLTRPWLPISPGNCTEGGAEGGRPQRMFLVTSASVAFLPVCRVPAGRLGGGGVAGSGLGSEGAAALVVRAGGLRLLRLGVGLLPLLPELLFLDLVPVITVFLGKHIWQNLPDVLHQELHLLPTQKLESL